MGGDRALGAVCPPRDRPEPPAAGREPLPRPGRHRACCRWTPSARNRCTCDGARRPTRPRCDERRRALLAALPRHICAAELERLRALHGQVVLWDAHSICSVLPRFFEGKLPDLNLGTADGRACAAAVQAAAEAPMAAQTGVHPRQQTAASRAAGSRATTARPSRASTRCSSRSARAPTWTRRAPFAYRHRPGGARAAATAADGGGRRAGAPVRG